MDAEPWGKEYQIVSRKTGANAKATLESEKLKKLHENCSVEAKTKVGEQNNNKR